MNEFNPIDLNANRERQEAAAREAKLALDRTVHDFDAVMDTPAGRRTVYLLLQMSGVFDRAPAGSPTVYEDGRREGRRDIGVALLEMLAGPCRRAYMLMLQEAETNV